MVEQGLQLLIQGNGAVAAICPVGGFMCEVPKGSALPTWTWRSISDTGEYTLTGFDGLACRRLQIDCYGRPDPQHGPADAITLANAITGVLRDYIGTLSDPERTRVQWCKQIDVIDFFDDTARSYRRLIEFYVWYNAG